MRFILNFTQGILDFKDNNQKHCSLPFGILADVGDQRCPRTPATADKVRFPREIMAPTMTILALLSEDQAGGSKWLFFLCGVLTIFPNWPLSPANMPG